MFSVRILIHLQVLRLSQSSKAASSVGEVVNLLANDASKFDYNLHFIAFFFVGPIQLLIFFVILWQEFQIAALVGVGYILLLSPSQCKLRTNNISRFVLMI